MWRGENSFYNCLHCAYAAMHVGYHPQKIIYGFSLIDNIEIEKSIFFIKLMELQKKAKFSKKTQKTLRRGKKTKCRVIVSFTNKFMASGSEVQGVRQG